MRTSHVQAGGRAGSSFGEKGSLSSRTGQGVSRGKQPKVGNLHPGQLVPFGEDLRATSKPLSDLGQNTSCLLNPVVPGYSGDQGCLQLNLTTGAGVFAHCPGASFG